MIGVADLLRIAFDVDTPAVVNLVRRHCVRFRQRPDDFNRAERALLAEAARWKRTDPRPPVPAALLPALVEAVAHEEGLGRDAALRRARRVIAESTALRQLTQLTSTTPTTHGASK